MGKHLSLMTLVLSIFVPCEWMHAQELSLTAASPEVPVPFGEADIIRSNAVLPLHRTRASLGLPAGVNIDAFSDGWDSVPWNVPLRGVPLPAIKIYVYSVTPGTTGIPGEAVNNQVAGNGAACDKFAIIIQFQISPAPPPALLVLVSPPLLWCDAVYCNLSPLPALSDIDGLDHGTDGYNPVRINDIKGIYFSLDSASAATSGLGTGAHIFYRPYGVNNPAIPPRVFATPEELGLLPNDDIDAIAMFDVQITQGFLGDGDMVYVSLREGSPTLALLGASAADVLQVYPGAPFVTMPEAMFGLLPTDDLNALTSWDPGEENGCDLKLGGTSHIVNAWLPALPVVNALAHISHASGFELISGGAEFRLTLSDLTALLNGLGPCP